MVVKPQHMKANQGHTLHEMTNSAKNEAIHTITLQVQQNFK